jgi:predicted PurR-regulated permease PerM
MHAGNLTGTYLAERNRMTEPSREFPKEEHGVQRGKRHRRRYGWRSTEVLRTAALVFGLYLLARLFWIANPLFLTTFLGILFGLAVSSGVDALQRFKIPRGIGAGLIVLAFFGLLFGFGAWVAPTIRSQGVELRRKLPEALERVETWARTHQNGMVGIALSGFLSDSTAADKQPAVADTANAASAKPDSSRAIAPTSPVAPESVTVAATIKDKLGSRIGGAKRFLFPFLTSTFEIVGGLLIIVFLSIYIAADPTLYHDGIMQLFPRPRRKRAGEVLSAIAAVLRRWLITQLIAMAVIGTVSTIVLLVLGVKAAFALGLLAGLFEFIPTVGPIISAVPAIAMGFLDSPEKALIVAVAYFGIQFMENHLLIPLLMKGGVDVPPALTILSQALMAMLFGFLGLMCAVPLLAATMVGVKMLYVENVVGEKSLSGDENPQRGVE